MMKNTLVADVMTRDPITADPEKSLLECARIMVKKRVGSLPLVKNKRLVGFLGESDILWALIKTSKKTLSEIKAIDISQRKIATISPSSNLEQAFEKMKRLKIEKLPVISRNEFIGMITAKDILNFHPELYPELEEFNKIREESEKLRRIQSRGKIPRTLGICEECGNTDLLYQVNGTRVCENCR